jgi:hypothetical protein
VLEGLESQRVGGVLIDGDHPWCARMGGLEHPAEEALSCTGITRGAQHEVQRRTIRVEGPVEIVSLLCVNERWDYCLGDEARQRIASALGFLSATWGTRARRSPNGPGELEFRDRYAADPHPSQDSLADLGQGAR